MSGETRGETRGDAKGVDCPWCAALIRAPVLSYYDEHVFLHPQFGALPSVDLVCSSCPKCEREVIVEASVSIELRVRKS